ncbi:MAG: hypothetical protein AAF789_00495 [Bacteroidota bacterium]
MKAESTQLLQKQIDKLDNEDFDLEAWKMGAISVLQRLFGESDVRSKQIEALKIDYSSWALRDSNANYKPIETAKRKGKEILTTAIDEISIFGLPESSASQLVGNETAKELEGMDKNQRKKYFSAMKKDKLVELLMQLT